MNNATLINQTSGKVEYYTPPEIVEAARRVMGGIDLDPASSRLANMRIKASKIFTRHSNGLKRQWKGRVWMNHPFHAGWKACTAQCRRKSCVTRGHHIHRDIPGNADWINKLEAEFVAGRTTEALCITFASTSEAWFRPLLLRPQCYFIGRVGYLSPTGEVLPGATKGSVVTYFGTNVERFRLEFSSLGVVKEATAGPAAIANLRLPIADGAKAGPAWVKHDN